MIAVPNHRSHLLPHYTERHIQSVLSHLNKVVRHFDHIDKDKDKDDNNHEGNHHANANVTYYKKSKLREADVYLYLLEACLIRLNMVVSKAPSTEALTRVLAANNGVGLDALRTAERHATDLMKWTRAPPAHTHIGYDKYL